MCELQQRGTASRSWVAGRYSNQEASVQAFDLMVADRYAEDGVASQRLVRERYDLPVDMTTHRPRARWRRRRPPPTVAGHAPQAPPRPGAAPGAQLRVGARSARRRAARRAARR